MQPHCSQHPVLLQLQQPPRRPCARGSAPAALLPCCRVHRPAEPIKLEAGQTVQLTCNTSKQASASVLPISYPSLAGTGLQPGRSVFVGQYLFTGDAARAQLQLCNGSIGSSFACDAAAAWRVQPR